MEIFHIQAPDAQQRSAIAKNMIKNSIERLGFPLNTEVPKEVLDAMTSFEPRQLQNKIQIALALATIDQCPQLGLKHWLRAIRGGGGPAKRSIGFVPS